MNRMKGRVSGVGCRVSEKPARIPREIIGPRRPPPTPDTRRPTPVPSSCLSLLRLVFVPLLFCLLTAAMAPAATVRPRVYVLRVDGVISPAAALYIQRGIEEAQ